MERRYCIGMLVCLTIAATVVGSPVASAQQIKENIK